MGDVISAFFNSLPDEQRKETVNSPAHYGSGTYEAINVIEAYDMGFLDGNVLKYLLRYKKKNGLEDLKKAKWYLERLITNIESYGK